MLHSVGKSCSMFGHSLRGRRMRKEFAVLAMGCLTLGLMAALGSAQVDKGALVISKKTGEWGTAYPGQPEDLARIDMKASTLPSAVENFTIAFDKTASGCTLRMDWETTRASVEIAKM